MAFLFGGYRFDYRRGHQAQQFSQTRDGRECMMMMMMFVCLSVLIRNEVNVYNRVTKSLHSHS